MVLVVVIVRVMLVVVMVVMVVVKSRSRQHCLLSCVVAVARKLLLRGLESTRVVS